LDEFTDNKRPDHPFNIVQKSYIGTDEPGLKNADYPQCLYDSITLIGKNCALPEGVRIGCGCYVSSAVGDEYFQKTKILSDGLSIICDINNSPDPVEEGAAG
ncbi:MAG: hypothetical protein ACRCUT_08185, partial [Spirochaetota bacterium]